VIKNKKLTIAIKAARKAGKIAKENFTQTHNLTYKTDVDIVSQTDLAADKILKDTIQGAFPDHAFFSEESGLDKHESDYLWIVDPIDGTTNFTHGIPRFSVSIALLYKNKLYAAVVYDPLHDDLYTAQAGKGAWLNDKPIEAGDEKIEPSRSIITMSRGTQPGEKERHARIYQTMIGNSRTIRILNSTALDVCAVAAGRLHAHINNSCNLYDCVAGTLIAQEAGAIVTTFTGDKLPLDITRPVDFLACVPSLHEKYIEVLKEA